jgi:hypothetical protein
VFDADDPLRPVGLVVAALAASFLAVLAAVQFGGGRPEQALTLPLVVAVPVVAAAFYWYYKRR